MHYYKKLYMRLLVEYLRVLVVFVHAWQCWDCPFSRQHKSIQAKKFSQVEKAVAKYKCVLLMLDLLAMV